MSGDHPLLERKLRKNGKSAMATVVSYERTKSGPMVYGASRKSLCTLRLRVAPDGEPAFEVTTEAWLTGTEGAHDGMVVPVLYDPSDHSKLIVDQSDAAWKDADRETMRARRLARASARGEDPARMRKMTTKLKHEASSRATAAATSTGLIALTSLATGRRPGTASTTVTTPSTRTTIVSSRLRSTPWSSVGGRRRWAVRPDRSPR
jgi:hypothetical protein